MCLISGGVRIHPLWPSCVLVPSGSVASTEPAEELQRHQQAVQAPVQAVAEAEQERTTASGGFYFAGTRVTSLTAFTLVSVIEKCCLFLEGLTADQRRIYTNVQHPSLIRLSVQNVSSVPQRCSQTSAPTALNTAFLPEDDAK